jgi:hypothetical protein
MDGVGIQGTPGPGPNLHVSILVVRLCSYRSLLQHDPGGVLLQGRVRGRVPVLRRDLCTHRMLVYEELLLPARGRKPGMWLLQVLRLQVPTPAAVFL